MRESGRRLVDPVADLAVQEIYCRARVDPTRIVGSVRLAVALLGERCIRLADRRELPGRSALAWAGAHPVIHLRRDLTPCQINHAVAHELGEWLLHTWRYRGREAENLAGRIGAALCVPREAFHVAWHDVGDDLSELSRAFTVSESLIALRIGECIGYPTALLTPRRVLTRGAPWKWPTRDGDWRKLVAHASAAGLVRLRVHDARGRLVLRAARGSPRPKRSNAR
jgi:hypothetical protein